MPKKVTPKQREAILRMLAQGQDRDTIAVAAGVTPGQVSAIAAHVKMGTYSLPEPDEPMEEAIPPEMERTTNLLTQLQHLESSTERKRRLGGVLLGAHAETGEDVFWNPDPGNGAANPHVLVLGESGFGKTYTVACLLAELARDEVVSVVFDYGQGFSPGALPKEFLAATDPLELHAGRDGVDINPLQIFPSDLHGPVNVAQRVADTFTRVYPRMGVQQHAVLRQAVLDVMADAGIVPDAPDSWSVDLPAFGALQSRLLAYARDPLNPQARRSWRPLFRHGGWACGLARPTLRDLSLVSHSHTLFRSLGPVLATNLADSSDASHATNHFSRFGLAPATNPLE